jgi:hypothetical protein
VRKDGDLNLVVMKKKILIFILIVPFVFCTALSYLCVESFSLYLYWLDLNCAYLCLSQSSNSSSGPDVCSFPSEVLDLVASVLAQQGFYFFFCSNRSRCCFDFPCPFFFVWPRSWVESLCTLGSYGPDPFFLSGLGLRSNPCAPLAPTDQIPVPPNQKSRVFSSARYALMSVSLSRIPGVQWNMRKFLSCLLTWFWLP